MEEFRQKMLGLIDDALSHQLLVTGEKRALLLAVRQYVMLMTEEELRKLQSLYPSNT